tara:strand:- start:22 stop:678 length:657 start_codon:yes stop_codon:yes gene_type:complete
MVLKSGERVTLGSLRTGGQMTLDLLSYLDEGLVFHDTPVISPVSNPEGTASLDAQAGEDLVKRMFARAWEDGKITKDEQQLITEVVTFLGMHPERVGRLSDEARRAQNAPPPEDVYRDMLRQALVDGEIVEDEIALLTTMRQAFSIDSETHNRLLDEARADPVLDEATNTYRATLITALEDGMITSDEDAMLSTLRENLGISVSKHASLLAELLDKSE